MAEDKYILGLNPIFNSRRTGISYSSLKNFPPIPPKIITLDESTKDNSIVDVHLGDEPIVHKNNIDLVKVGDKFLANFFPLPGKENRIIRVNFEKRSFLDHKGEDDTGNFLQFEIMGDNNIDLTEVNNSLLGNLDIRGYYGFGQIPSLASYGTEAHFFVGLFFLQGKNYTPRLMVLDVKKDWNRYAVSHTMVEVVDRDVLDVVERRDKLYFRNDDLGNIIISVRTIKLNRPYFLPMAVYKPKNRGLELIDNTVVAF